MVLSPNSRKSGRVDLKAHDINLPGVVEIGSYHYRSARRGIEKVSHAGCMGICHLAKGAQTYRINHQLYHLKGGDQLLILPGETLDTAGTPEEKGRLFWFIFQATPVEGPLLFLDNPAAQTLREALLELPRRHFSATPESDEIAATILHRLTTRPETGIERLELSHLIQRYLFLTLTAAQGTVTEGPSPRIQKCLDYISHHLDETLPVSQLARSVGLSESRFKKRFREEVGTPPGDYVLRTKISAAKIALHSSEISITALAHDLGFSTSQYFATVFRRFADTTPSEYRRTQSGTKS